SRRHRPGPAAPCATARSADRRRPDLPSLPYRDTTAKYYLTDDILLTYISSREYIAIHSRRRHADGRDLTAHQGSDADLRPPHLDDGVRGALSPGRAAVHVRRGPQRAP